MRGHHGVALMRKGLAAGEEHPVVAADQTLGLFPGQRDGALFLEGALLLLHLELGGGAAGPVGSQANLAADLDALELLEVVAVVDGVEVQGADDVPVAAVVGVGVHDGGEAASKPIEPGLVDEVFLLVAKDFERHRPRCSKTAVASCRA